MTVDIRNFDIVYLHGPNRPERKEHMEKHLHEKGLGLRSDCHVGVSDKGSWSGVTGMISIMKKRLEGEFKPFILMEDDCSPTEWFRYEVPLPDDADALYIGLSAYGLHPQHNFGILRVEYTSVPDEPELVRVYNMLSMHAVIFMTRRWTESCLEGFEKTLRDAKDPAYDIEMCRSLPQFNAYAVRKPLFFQDAKVNGQQEPTYILFS